MIPSENRIKGLRELIDQTEAIFCYSCGAAVRQDYIVAGLGEPDDMLWLKISARNQFRGLNNQRRLKPACVPAFVSE